MMIIDDVLIREFILLQIYVLLLLFVIYFRNEAQVLTDMEFRSNELRVASIRFNFFCEFSSGIPH
jgi:hypothetical protein